MERVAKYVPTEIIAAYLAANGVVASFATSGARLIWYVLTFGLCLILTPIYLGRMAAPGQPQRLQKWMSTIAFMVWAYSLGGLFSELHVYYPGVASLLLIFFSLVSGAFAPRGGDP